MRVRWDIFRRVSGVIRLAAPYYFDLWGTLALLTPYLEQTNVYNAINLTETMFQLTVPWGINSPVAVQTFVPTFMCPSDRMVSVCSNEYSINGQLARTNYAFCMGTGTTTGVLGWLGSPYQADGVYYAQVTTRLADITDGTSNTVGISERILGNGAENSTAASLAAINPQTMYVYPRRPPTRFVRARFKSTWSNFACTPGSPAIPAAPATTTITYPTIRSTPIALPTSAAPPRPECCLHRGWSEHCPKPAPQRGQCGALRRQRPIRFEFDCPVGLAGAGDPRRRRGHRRLLG